MTSVTGPAFHTRISLIPSSAKQSNPTSMEHITAQLAVPLPLAKQIALVDELYSSYNFDINDIVIDVDGPSPQRLLDVAIKNRDKEFATYLVVEKGANLKLCEALYALENHDWQTEELVNALVNALDERAVPLQFQFTIEGKTSTPVQESSEIQATNEITLDLSLQEAKKLTQISSLFCNEWTNSTNEGNPRLIAPQHIKLSLFKQAIYAVLGRTVEQTAMSPEDISSLIEAINFLDMADSSAVISSLVTIDSLIDYINANIDANTLTLEEQQTLAESPDTQNEQIRQKLHNLRNCQDTFIYMALYAQSDANHAFATTAVTQLNKENTLDIERYCTTLIHLGNKATSDLERKRIAQLITTLTLNNPAAKTLLTSTPDYCNKMLTKMWNAAKAPDTKMAIATATGEIAGKNAKRAMLIDTGNHADSDPLREAVAKAINTVINGINSTESAAICHMLVKMGNQASSDQTRAVIVNSIAKKIGSISTPADAAPAYDMLISMSYLASSDELVQAIADVINRIITGGVLASFSTEAMRDRLIDMSQYASTDNTKGEIAKAIRKVVRSGGANFPVTEDMRNMLIKMGHEVTSDNARQAIGDAIAGITDNHPERLSIFATGKMFEMLLHIGNQANSDRARLSIIRAINTFISNNQLEQFLHPDNTMMHDMLVSVGCKTSHLATIWEIEKLITLIIDCGQQGLNLVSTPDIYNMLINMEDRIRTGGGLLWPAWEMAITRITVWRDLSALKMSLPKPV